MTTIPQRRARTRGTTVLLVFCVLIAATSVVGAALLPGYVRDGARREAETTLRVFLDAATRGDADWSDAASQLLRDAVPLGAPVIGDSQTADALHLASSYTAGELSFSGRRLERSDTASAIVTIRYRYRILGEKGTASIPQKIWLTRPFYYGSDEPQRADPKKKPTAVGPWRVTGITVPGSGERTAARSELGSDARGSADDIDCASPASALAQLADRVRIDAALASSCFLGAEDGSDVLEEGMDRDALIAAFPAIDDSEPASMPAEITRIEGDPMHALRAPFTQYLVAEHYVLTFAAVNVDDDETSTRLVRIDDREVAG